MRGLVRTLAMRLVASDVKPVIPSNKKGKIHRQNVVFHRVVPNIGHVAAVLGVELPVHRAQFLRGTNVEDKNAAVF